MARDAPAISISPAQNSANPSPVPGPSTVMATPGEPTLNSSWTAVEMGCTVDEPEMVMLPSSPVGAGGAVTVSPAEGDCATALPLAATVAARTMTPVSAGRRVDRDMLECPPAVAGAPRAGARLRTEQQVRDPT